MQVKNYLLMEEVGSGSYATVYKAKNVETGEICAIKRMREMPRNDEIVVQNQIDLLKRIKHKNIVRYIDDFKEKQKWYIVFEYCGKGDLEKYKNKQGRLPEYFCKTLMYLLIDVLTCLHENKIVHRDLKLANVLINDNYDLKLADFGFSKDNELGYMQSFCGTPYAMAPEILRMEQYDERCDTWSLGIMLYQLLYGKLPFAPSKQYGAGMPGLAKCIFQAEPHYDESIEISSQCQKFLKLCLTKNVEQRPSAAKLTQHPWFRQGTASHIRKEYFQNSLDDKTEASTKAQQIINGAIHEHVTKIIKVNNLSDALIKTHLKSYDKYFQSKSTRGYILLMVAKTIKELTEVEIQLDIEGIAFRVPLNEIKTFHTHIKNLTKMIESELKNCEGYDIGNKFIERQLFQFVSGEGHACLKLFENYSDKNQLLEYLSDLPLRKPENSQLKIQTSNDQIHLKKKFIEVIEKLSISEIIKIINQSYCHEDIHSNYLIEQQFKNKQREGGVFELGYFINQIIKINNQDINKSVLS